ncbi:MAG: hypothetical protein J0H55_03665 [Chitinophagaceae bacterium]|nr:hypothetical protein [Chitinophagaceae bacterium]
MTLLDLVLLPFYIGILYLISFYYRKKLPNQTLKKYHFLAFWLKIFSSLIIVAYFYAKVDEGSDSLGLYYPEGLNLFHLLLKDTDNWKYLFVSGENFDSTLIAHSYNYGYYLIGSNFMVIKITALLCFLTFGRYLLISLLFGYFAFSGLWKLFMFFYNKKPELHKAFALSILFFPSVVFWSSGVLKDSLCIGALGWLTYSLDLVFNGNLKIKNGLIALASAYLIFSVKSYILLAYAPFFLLYLFLVKLQVVKSIYLRGAIAFFLISGIIAGFAFGYSYFQKELGQYALENVTKSISSLNSAFNSLTGDMGAESNFNLGASFDGTFTGFLKIAPFAITATFFRPFIWETTKVSQLLAALESLLLAYFTIRILLQIGIFRFAKYIFTDPLINFCFLFAVAFGLFVGTATLNFGTLVRYKIPCMPFFAIALFLINQKASVLKKQKSLWPWLIHPIFFKDLFLKKPIG